MLHGLQFSSDSSHGKASKRRKKVPRVQIPLHKAHGGAFYALPSVITKFTTAPPVSPYGSFCKGHPELFRRSDSQTMLSKVKTGEKILLNKHQGSTAQKARSTETH